jgi:galactose mutarotase-like enzyme
LSSFPPPASDVRPLQACSDPYPHWLFTAASGDQLRVVPERGGLVTSWVCGGQELLYLDQQRFADPTKSVRGGIPVLFPICGNLAGSPLPQHGFARDLPWQLEPLPGAGAGSAGSADLASAHPDGIRLRLSDSDATRQVYPHAFVLELEYRLLPNELAITARITNPGDSSADPLPFSLGLHPYFAVPDLTAVQLEGLPERCFDHIPMAEAATAEQLQRLASGVDFLAHPAGPVRLVQVSQAGQEQTGHQQTGTRRWIALHTQPPLDLAVVWSEPPRPMLCLEPWTAPRGAMATGERLLHVQPGATLELQCSYTTGLG